jgi:organic radical activating enzyme
MLGVQGLPFSKKTKELFKRVLSFHTAQNITAFQYLRYLYHLLRTRKYFFFEVHLTEHCNLGCKGCTHFSPLAEETYVNLYRFEQDMTRMSELMGEKVNKIHLLGGEPLLHPQVDALMRITARLFPKANILLVTNGLLLQSRSDAFWNTCKECGITVCPTKYPINLDYDAMRQTAAAHSVDFRFYNSEQVVKTLKKHVLDIRGSQKPKLSFIAYEEGMKCIQLKDGKLFLCALSAYINHFNSYFGVDLQITNKDFIDIYETKSWKDVLRFTERSIPFCKYCNPGATIRSIEWSYSKKEINEWT